MIELTCPICHCEFFTPDAHNETEVQGLKIHCPDCNNKSQLRGFKLIPFAVLEFTKITKPNTIRVTLST